MNNQLYNRFKNICRVYNQIDFPRFTTNRISSVHLIWNRDHHMANKSAPMEPGFRLSHDYANNKTFRALVYGNIPFELYYPEISPGKLKPESMPVLMYAGQSFLSRKTAEKILSYIKKGGHMICVQNYPYKTKHGEKLEVFEKYIISPKGSFQTENNCYVQMGECSRDEFPKMIKLDTTILQEFDLDSVKDSKPGDLNPFFYKHMYIGYTRKIGKGKLSVLGFPLTKNSVEPILDALGIQSPLTVSNSDLLTTVQIDSRNLSGGSKPEILLGILNPENEPVNATLKLDLGQLSILAQTDFSMEDYALNYMFKKKKEVLDSVKKIPVALKAQSGELLWLKPQNEKENLN